VPAEVAYEDRCVMPPLPPVPPNPSALFSTRLDRDHYVRFDSKRANPL
jgi:hypothetical protein